MLCVQWLRKCHKMCFFSRNNTNDLLCSWNEAINAQVAPCKHNTYIFEFMYVCVCVNNYGKRKNRK